MALLSRISRISIDFTSKTLPYPCKSDGMAKKMPQNRYWSIRKEWLGWALCLDWACHGLLQPQRLPCHGDVLNFNHANRRRKA
jgi:hypothetical protein